MISSRQGNVPQRTCLGCRRTRPKPELIRIVNNEGKAELDLSAKKSGRGAYVCPSGSCWEKALKGNRLENALKAQVLQEDKDKLLQYSENFG